MTDRIKARIRAVKARIAEVKDLQSTFDTSTTYGKREHNTCRLEIESLQRELYELTSELEQLE